MDPALDYRTVDSIGHSRIMASINQFAERTVDFLNRFSNICDLKLLEIHEKLNDLDILTTILEKKIQSVNGLNFVPGQPLPKAPPPPPQSTSQPVPDAPPPPETQPTEGGETPPPPPSGEGGETPQENTQGEEGGFDPKTDPQYAKWYKRLSIGVPLAALTPQMIQEGLDPEVLRPFANN